MPICTIGTKLRPSYSDDHVSVTIGASGFEIAALRLRRQE